MAGGAGIGDGVIILRGWGTASHMVHVMVATMFMTIVLGRPKLSGALEGLVEARLGSSHGVVTGGLRLVVVGRVLAGVAAVRIRDVCAVGPAIVEIVIAFAIGRPIWPCWWELARGLVSGGRLVAAAALWGLIRIVGRLTWWRQGWSVWLRWWRCLGIWCRWRWQGIWWRCMGWVVGCRCRMVWRWRPLIVWVRRPVLASWIMAGPSSATTAMLSLMLWWRGSGGQEHHMLLDVCYLLLQLLILNGHVGQLGV